MWGVGSAPKSLSGGCIVTCTNTRFTRRKLNRLGVRSGRIGGGCRGTSVRDAGLGGTADGVIVVPVVV